MEAGGKRVGPGACFTAAEIAELYSGFDVSLLPSEGPWYTRGWEHDSEARRRAARVASWLRSGAFREEHGNSLVVLVMHGHFIDTLQKMMVGVADDPDKDPDGKHSTGGWSGSLRLSFVKELIVQRAVPSIASMSC